jgi:hypothetical protein
MTHPHEQKYLLHNWSNCRYRDRPQSPGIVLRVARAGVHKRTIFVADAHREDRQRFVVRADEKLRAFLTLERLADESFRLCSVGQKGGLLLLPPACAFDDMLMFAAARIFLC